MADSYTPDLRIVQMPTGSNDGLWGDKADAAFLMLEQAIAGLDGIDMTAANVVLTTANNAADQARNAALLFGGTPGVTRTVTMPDVKKLTWMINASDSPIIFTSGSGDTATVPNGQTALIGTDGAGSATILAITQTDTPVASPVPLIYSAESL